MYSPLSGITHEALMNMPIFCKISKGNITEYTCMYLFHTSINIAIHTLNIPNYFKAEVILEEEGLLVNGRNNILHTEELEGNSSTILINDVAISGGWYSRRYNLYMRVYGLEEMRLIKRFYINPTTSITFPSKSYLLSVSNALSNSDINIWKRAISLHIGNDVESLNRSAIHTLMVIYALNFKPSTSTDIQHILLIIMNILGKRITKEILYITVKRIVDFKYHSEKLINDIIIEMEDYINSNTYQHDKFMELIQLIKNMRL